jgi:hypothetical protein
LALSERRKSRKEEKDERRKAPAGALFSITMITVPDNWYRINKGKIIMQNIELNDFYSAAFLIAAGNEMKEIYRLGNQSVFVFDGLDSIKEQLGRFYAMSADVNAAAYAREIKKLKTIIHNTYTKSGNGYAGKDNL